ncbi:MAG: DUF1638 domain-containing protein [Thermodesulfobacteriota bacterium]
MKKSADICLPADCKVLACRVFEPELRSLRLAPEQVVYLDQGLHRYPDQLRETLALGLGELEQDPALRRVVLAYGYCGGGLEGLQAQRVELVLPLAHDCIPLLLGRRSGAARVDCGATFYLSPGWVEHGKTPYTEYFVTADKFGAEDALWAGKEMLKGYREVALIQTLAGLKARHRRYAQDMARLFGLGCRQVQGRAGWLRRLLQGRASQGLTVLPPGQPVHLGLYPQAAPAGPAESESRTSCRTS